MKKSTKKFALGTILAAITGYFAGILTAPKSGKETRKDIKDTASKGLTEAEKKLKKLHSQLETTINEATKNLQKLTGKTKKELQTALASSNAAKTKAQDLLSAVHEGKAKDSDLEQVITSTTNAVDHLKKFLKKPSKKQ